jgi:hypothetical protein
MLQRKSPSYVRESSMMSPELEVRPGSLREDEAGGLDTTEQDKRSTAWSKR